MTYYEVNNIDNRMVIDSEWPEDDIDEEEEVFEEDEIDDFD